MFDSTVTSDKNPEAALADLKVSLAESNSVSCGSWTL